MKIIFSARQEIYGLTPDQRTQLKDKLTFDNPAYKNAQKFGRYKYTKIPPYLTYYTEHSVRVREGERTKVLNVPIGVNVQEILNVPDIDIVDCRKSHKVSYPQFVLNLREDQALAESSYLRAVKNSFYPKCLIQLPTGKGKTVLAIHLASVLRQKTLILVHKDDLVGGWKEDIEKCFDGKIDVGLIKAKSRKIGEQITIATVQTLGRMSDEERQTYLDKFGFVVQDECHHTGLNIFNIIDQFNSKYKLGLSATPKRNDGLDFVFDLFFGGIGYSKIVVGDDEDICSVKVEVLDSSFKYKPFCVDGQPFNYYDFEEKDLPKRLVFIEEMPYDERPTIPFHTLDNEAVTSDETGLLVCSHIIDEYNKGRSVLVMFNQKEHINSYYDYLIGFIPENKIMKYYGDSKESSNEMRRRAEEREVLVTLATYSKAVEGTNVKSWEVLFLVSSINNEKDTEQAIGRIRRKKEGKIEPVIVYDVRYPYCYSLRNHFNTRNRVYKKFKFEVSGIEKKTRGKKSIFSRGY